MKDYDSTQVSSLVSLVYLGKGINADHFTAQFKAHHVAPIQKEKRNKKKPEKRSSIVLQLNTYQPHVEPSNNLDQIHPYFNKQLNKAKDITRKRMSRTLVKTYRAIINLEPFVLEIFDIANIVTRKGSIHDVQVNNHPVKPVNRRFVPCPTHIWCQVKDLRKTNRFVELSKFT